MTEIPNGTKDGAFLAISGHVSRPKVVLSVCNSGNTSIAFDNSDAPAVAAAVLEAAGVEEDGTECDNLGAALHRLRMHLAKPRVSEEDVAAIQADVTQTHIIGDAAVRDVLERALKSGRFKQVPAGPTNEEVDRG